MAIFYSQAQRGFFSDKVHATLPADVIEVTEQKRAELLQAETDGMEITVDGGGIPVAQERVQPIGEVAAQKVRAITKAKLQRRTERFSCTALGSAHFYAIDAQAQADLSGLLQVLQLTDGLGDDYPCSALADGELIEVAHTTAQLQSVLISGAQWIKAWNSYERTLLASIAAAETVEALDAITVDFSGVSI